jgi:branched-chain amino acid transport system substrate-binding protein
VKNCKRWSTACLAVASAGVLAAGCGSSDSGSSSSTSSGSSSTSSSASAGALGTPKKATGSPYVFGMINDESSQVTFPEARQGGLAAAQYVNNYLGGINGHPIKIVSCIGDASPATGARCANQLVSKHPVAIIGAADIGSVAAVPVYGKADLAYIGGIPFTPVEQNAPNAIIFTSVSLGDNAAMSYYAAKTLGVKKAAVLYTNDSQGKLAGLGVIPSVMKAAGVSDVKTIGVPPATPDPTSQAAAAIQGNPDAVYVDLPNGCGNMLKALKTLGYKGKLMGIDPCTDPRVIKSAAGGAEGFYYASPFVLQSGTSKDAKIFQAAMQKYAPNAAIDSISTTVFSGVVNLQAKLSNVAAPLTTAKILAAFKSGTDNPNFLAHPYTCNGKQIAGARAVCNDQYLINQIKNDQPTQASSTDWVTSKGYFKGLPKG